MKLATFTYCGVTRIGVVDGDRVTDLSRVVPDLPTDMIAFLEAGEKAMEAARSATSREGESFPLDQVRLEAPVLRPRKFLAMGANYTDKVKYLASRPELKEKGIQVPEYQIWFNKQVTCINGPYDPVEMPSVSVELDYEVELAFVIGKRCRHVTKDDAAGVIAGYLICNDVSVRDWQLRTPTATLGKSFDTHGPIGPWLVTADEVGDPHALGLRCYVNGEERQNGSTSDMIFGCFDIVEYLSTVFTLEPGDVLSTSSPLGSGAMMNPPQYLKVGDIVRCEVDGIGHIENVVVAET